MATWSMLLSDGPGLVIGHVLAAGGADRRKGQAHRPLDRPATLMQGMIPGTRPR